MVPIDAAALPGLDAKVQEYVDVIVALDVHSPGVRHQGRRRARRWATTTSAPPPTRRTGCSPSPVRAMQQGPLSEGGKVAATLLDLRRTIEDLDPKQATGVKKLLGLIPFGDKIVDYFRKYESAQTHLDAIIKALYDGQDELRKDNAALEQEKLHLWETMQRLTQYIYIAKQLDAALAAQDRRDRGHRPREGEGAPRRRAVLRAPEAPGPADAAGGVDPGLPGHRPRPEEQHRADQGRRPGDDHDDRRAAHRGDRRAGAGEPEAGARPDHRAEHHDVEAHRVDVGDARDPERRHQQAGRVVDGRHRVAAGRVREHLPVDGRDRHVQDRRRSTRWARRSPRSRPRSTSRRPTWQRVRASDAQGRRRRARLLDLGDPPSP